MEFLLWHYGPGLNRYLRRWLYAVGWVIHYFSLTRLIPSLFSPWKRLTDNDDVVGINIEKLFRQLTFNLISRTIGAIVRLVLFISGLLLLIPVITVGAIGLAFWLFCPFIGLPYFLLTDPQENRFFTHLTDTMSADPSQAVTLAFDTPPGKFVLSHVGLSLSDITGDIRAFDLSLEGFYPTTFGQIIHYFIEAGVWDKQSLRQKGVDFTDLVTAARWWDSKYRLGETGDPTFHYSRSGVGLDLLFGYTPVLNQYSTDLALPQSFSHHLIGRAELVTRVERTLSSGTSVLLVGRPGVGKKTVVLEFARRSLSGELGPKMTYSRVMELDYNFLLAESLDLNKKKAYLSSILSEAAGAGNVILVIRDLHRLTHSEVEGLDFTDLFETHLEKRRLKMIVVASQTDYDRFLAGNIRLKKFFDVIEIEPVSIDTAMEILIDFADHWETTRHLTITAQSLRAIITGCDKYITDTPFPEKSLEILDAVVSFVDKNAKNLVTVDDVNAVLAETTGISLARLTENERRLLADLETVLHKRLVGQDAAITMVAKSLRARSVGAKSENRPLGSFLFLGPTGVGKTETAKTLAQVYFGDVQYLLRFDMAEYAGREGLSRLIGSVERNLPGKLTTSIKTHPASLLLLDEIEKAPPEVYNLFLSLLDEGQVTDAFGTKINCRYLFVIATSNAGAEYIRKLVTQNPSSGQLQKQITDYIQTAGLFSSEFLNRFDGVVVFEPLTKPQLVDIAKIMIADLVKNMDARDIALTATPAVFDRLADQGYEPEFGARPMRRLVDITIGDVLGRALLSEKIKPGNRVRLDVDDQDGYTVTVV